MLSTKMASSSFDVHSTYQTDEVFPGYSYHENAEDFAMLWDTYEDVAPHSIVHELTFFIKEEDGSFSRHDEVHEERTYEVLTYDICWNRLVSSPSNSMPTLRTRNQQKPVPVGFYRTEVGDHYDHHRYYSRVQSFS